MRACGRGGRTGCNYHEEFSPIKNYQGNQVFRGEGREIERIGQVCVCACVCTCVSMFM